tara:strand:- start:24 stop:704 length:681 start_codon:yes stop_codon:yes gene_type:complete
MAFTRVVGAGIHTAANINSHNIKSTGIITATGLDISGNATIAGVLTYEDVTSIDSIGIITARDGIHVGAGISAVGIITASGLSGTLAGVSTNFVSAVGIQSAGTVIGAGITQLNFVGTGNTFAVSGTTVDISIAGGGGTGAGGTWRTYTAGIATNKSVGINTNTLDDNDLVGVGNSFQGLYISNGMMITDNKLSGNHYIGTAFNGLMAGPVTVEGTLTIDGNYVVV